MIVTCLSITKRTNILTHILIIINYTIIFFFVKLKGNYCIITKCVFNFFRCNGEEAKEVVIETALGQNMSGDSESS